ncbi:MAG TPA: aspartyl/asparaginyl beta-hydroxylase domain-containing protein [Oligoflexia bacterium]|nr:aspartyl/asparaginyl beta-hydroxylase domain-containing protein [Oligoflexia bacterium]HMR24459.1 aspartyl/asparaginyl beta-hydroxylase domain-containing protein [Oligoflexia bacterium]
MLKENLHYWTKKYGFKIIQWLEKRMERASKFKLLAFYDPYILPWVKGLEDQWQIIRAELDRLLEHWQQLPNFQDISKDQTAITQDDHWKTVIFYGYGFKTDFNCAVCPITAEILSKIPGMTTAMFSILSPGKIIPPHRGPYKGVLRYHLALKVPQDYKNCKIRVGETWLSWQQGKSILFDDTYEHEVINNTNEDRVVLFLDIVRPFYWPISWLNRCVIFLIGRSSYVQQAKQNNAAWEKKLKKIFQ